MGREQLWDDVAKSRSSSPASSRPRSGGSGPTVRARLCASRSGRRFHWALVALGLLGLAVLAWRRRWEALVLATVFLGITALSALLVASPRRVLVLLPLVAPLAGVGAPVLGRSRIRLPIAGKVWTRSACAGIA